MPVIFFPIDLNNRVKHIIELYIHLTCIYATRNSHRDWEITTPTCSFQMRVTKNNRGYEQSMHLNNHSINQSIKM